MSTKATAQALANKLGIELSVTYGDGGRLTEAEIWTLGTGKCVLDAGTHVAIESRESHESVANMWRAVVSLLRTVEACECTWCAARR